MPKKTNLGFDLEEEQGYFSIESFTVNEERYESSRRNQSNVANLKRGAR